MSFEAIIIGGGPAGATAASVLAMHGRRVLVLERDKFPRYHIGESLIPYCWYPLERIGFIEKMKASEFTKKYSVQFVGMNGKISQPFYFDQHYDHPSSQTWQVMRGDFDHRLLNHAREKGAEVREETRVVDFLREGDTVVGVRTEKEEFRAPMTIDCSGRDTLALNRNRWRVSDPSLNKISIWTYYRGSKRDPGKDEGATTIAFLPEKGWFWYLPLAGDTVSVGIVAEQDYLFQETKDLQTIFEREIENNLWIKDHLSQGERFIPPGQKDGPFYVTREWSYRSGHFAANGLVLAGDAFGFLDPVFSSGVFLALTGGERAADAVHAALEAGDVTKGRFADYATQMGRGIEAMRRLVHTFYDPAFSMRGFLTRFPERKGDVTDCLIGNVMRNFTDLYSALGEYSKLPERAAME